MFLCEGYETKLSLSQTKELTLYIIINMFTIKKKNFQVYNWISVNATEICCSYAANGVIATKSKFYLFEYSYFFKFSKNNNFLKFQPSIAYL